jgi:polyisoprenoid-binding protein YceI
VRDENLHGHLLSPEFFDSERYPEITFTSTGIRADGGLVVDGI